METEKQRGKTERHMEGERQREFKCRNKVRDISANSDTATDRETHMERDRKQERQAEREK